MKLSKDTLHFLLGLLNQANIPVAQDNFEQAVADVIKAKDELLAGIAALTAKEPKGITEEEK